MNKFTNIKCETGEIAKDYKSYLTTRHWKELREKVAEKSGYVCIRCQGIYRTNYHIHHNTYKRMGKEKISDLDFYCSKCHAVIHNNRQNKKDFNRQYNNLISSKMANFNEEQILRVLAYIDKVGRE